MNGNPNILEVTSLIGDASRATMLYSLLGGRALPASELAREAKITPQTASSHLAKLVEGGLISMETHGRHRYFKLASSDVAHALEAVSAIARPKPVRSLRESDQLRAVRYARTCYDHLAGEVGVRFTDCLLEAGVLDVHGCEYVVTTRGESVFGEFGLSVAELSKSRRTFARQCLDWSERRYHLAGGLGAGIVKHMFELEWISRIPGGRAIRVTETGQQGMKACFGFDV